MKAGRCIPNPQKMGVRFFPLDASYYVSTQIIYIELLSLPLHFYAAWQLLYCLTTMSQKIYKHQRRDSPDSTLVYYMAACNTCRPSVYFLKKLSNVYMLLTVVAIHRTASGWVPWPSQKLSLCLYLVHKERVIVNVPCKLVWPDWKADFAE